MSDASRAAAAEGGPATLRCLVEDGYLRTDTRLDDGTIVLRTVLDLAGDATLFVCARWSGRTSLDEVAQAMEAHGERVRRRMALALKPVEDWSQWGGLALGVALGLAGGYGGSAVGWDLTLLASLLPADYSVPAWLGGPGNMLFLWILAWLVRRQSSALVLRIAGPWVLRRLLRGAVFATAGWSPSDPERRGRSRRIDTTVPAVAR
ncbi:hypothetical protein JMJ56_31715 [Belnapia sp. T18]|uniref:Uncharacterized protein n=1 Tax=Belnapia arida TaxID=2804533 RepID=A0ABS1UCW1_9PROT|nr:hypothetical protein [Belnapia arida]MBL6082535.1 hypothetical protein [Belnapia arida]